MRNGIANPVQLAAHWEPGGGVNHEERIKKLEQELRVQRDSLADALKADVRLSELVENLSDIVAAQAEEIERLKQSQHLATGLVDQRTGHVVGLTWPVRNRTGT